MKYDYDLITIGLGPAGMAVSVMGSSMGLKVCAIEKNKIGGECMNIGCIPSKALLRMAKTRHNVTKLESMEMEKLPLPAVRTPFPKIQGHLDYINQKKVGKMFDKPNIDLFLAEGAATFVDPHTVLIGEEKKVTAKRIFIATGTSPAVPPIPGIDTVKDHILTNENIFSQPEVPSSMVIIGGGAIGSEMAQAFSRLGCKCSIVQMDPHLIPAGDPEAGELLESTFNNENIDVYNSKKIDKVVLEEGQVALYTEDGIRLSGEKLLVAAGRRVNLEGLKLEHAGIAHDRRGIIVNKYLQTNHKHIYAVGDCNGHMLFSHAAMHQGMLALMNSMSKWPVKFQYKNYVTPWTVFTEPQVSSVGLTEKQLKEQGIKYQAVKMEYDDYGATIAEQVNVGFIKAFVSPLGRVYGASIVGEGSGDMINEWALVVEKKMRMTDIMFMQHSFPTMGFITKMLSENWMMGKMKSRFLQSMCKLMFRI